MNRKLSFLSLTFITLLGVGAYLWMFGKPPTPNENPLKNVDMTKMSKLLLSNQSGSIRIEKQKDTWMIVAPFQDIADPMVVNELGDDLKNFTLGSVVSENPQRYSEFHVDPAQAAQVEAFVGDKSVLSGFVGKDAGQYQNSYFRFNVSSGPVYIASKLPDFQFRRNPNGFRQMAVLAFPSALPTHVRLQYGKKNWDVSRSSDTWTDAAGKKIDSGKAQDLVFNLRQYKADNVESVTKTPAELGFEAPATPFLVLTVDDGATYTFTVGKPLDAKAAPALLSRYARSSNRAVTFIVQEKTAKTIVDWFSNLSK